MNKKFVSGVVVAACAVGAPIAVSAQETARQTASRPLFIAGVEKSRPLHEAATVGILIPLQPLTRSGELGGQRLAYRGLLVEAAAGVEGFGVATGWGRRLKKPRSFAVTGEDIMATAFRTRNPLGGAATDATYVGGEVGLTSLAMRMSVGVARRVSGPQEADRTIFTWGVGFNIGR